MTVILVDGLPLSTPSAVRGIGTYLRSVLERVSAEPDLEIRALAVPGAQLPAGVSAVPVRRWASDRKSYYEQLLRLPGDIASAQADLFHSPATDPPRRSRLPWVQTLHDVTPLAYPGPGFRAERWRWHARGRLIRKAHAVIADSRNTADDAISHLGLDPARIEVVHCGVDPAFRPPAERPRAHPPYVLYVSAYGPHKGVGEAFQVIGALSAAGLPHRLAVVGAVARRMKPLVQLHVQQSGVADRIDLLGVVSLERLVELYQQADAVIVTSRYEGFGLPAVEAMATGTPLVAFDNSSLPEIVGDGGVLVPDGDLDAFAAAVVGVLDDEHRWKELSDAGVARASAFSWDKAATAHAEIYRAVAR